MGKSSVLVDLASDGALGGDLAAGGVFVAGCALPFDTECELVVRAGDRECRLEGRVVWVNARGAGIQILGYNAALRQRLEALADSSVELEAVTIQATERDTHGAGEAERGLAARPDAPSIGDESSVALDWADVWGGG
jgi:hypothetical protein